MKLFIFFCFLALFGWPGNGIEMPPQEPSGEQMKVLNDSIDFTVQIQPILVKNCSPCHFTGGKMYERMPFDKDTTILNHQAGILRRIKGEENNLLRSFIEQAQKQRNKG